MKHLNVRDLNLASVKKQQKRKESFEKVLQNCYSKIQGFADKEQAFCFYEVPEFMMGYPLYNISECVTFITEMLTKNGFQIQYYFPKVLYIAWGAPPKQSKAAEKRLASSPALKALPEGSRKSKFIDSVKSYKPSGKFVLNLT
jgi:hypothetical protein